MEKQIYYHVLNFDTTKILEKNDELIFHFTRKNEHNIVNVNYLGNKKFNVYINGILHDKLNNITYQQLLRNDTYYSDDYDEENDCYIALPNQPMEDIGILGNYLYFYGRVANSRAKT